MLDRKLSVVTGGDAGVIELVDVVDHDMMGV